MLMERAVDRCERLSKLLWYSGGRRIIIDELTRMKAMGMQHEYIEARLLNDAQEKEVEYRRRKMRENIITGGKA